MINKRGRPSKASADPLVRIAADEDVAAPYRRIARAASDKGITWSMLSRLSGVDLSAMRRAFHAERPPANSVRMYCKSIQIPEIAIRALCEITTRREAVGEIRVEIINLHAILHDRTQYELEDRDTISKIFDQLRTMTDSDVRVAGMRLILASHGLDELFRPHKYQNAKLDVLADTFKSFLKNFKVRELEYETLDDTSDQIQLMLESMNVSTADRIRIFDILQRYRGPHERFDAAFESVSTDRERQSLFVGRMAEIKEQERASLAEIEKEFKNDVATIGRRP